MPEITYMRGSVGYWNENLDFVKFESSKIGLMQIFRLFSVLMNKLQFDRLAWNNV